MSANTAAADAAMARAYAVARSKAPAIEGADATVEPTPDDVVGCLNRKERRIIARAARERRGRR